MTSCILAGSVPALVMVMVWVTGEPGARWAPALREKDPHVEATTPLPLVQPAEPSFFMVSVPLVKPLVGFTTDAVKLDRVFCMLPPTMALTTPKPTNVNRILRQTVSTGRRRARGGAPTAEDVVTAAGGASAASVPIVCVPSAINPTPPPSWQLLAGALLAKRNSCRISCHAKRKIGLILRERCRAGRRARHIWGKLFRYGLRLRLGLPDVPQPAAEQEHAGNDDEQEPHLLAADEGEDVTDVGDAQLNFAGQPIETDFALVVGAVGIAFGD